MGRMNPDRFKSWRRYSLRTMFVLMTLCSLVFGAWAVFVNPSRLQQRSLAVVNRLQGNTVKVPASGPPWHAWLVTTLLGKDAFAHVTELDLNGKNVTDDELRNLGGLKHLRRISLDHTPVTDTGLAVLASLSQLEQVSLRYTQVADDGASHLSRLPNLRTVHLTGTKITDAGASALAACPQITQLYIRWTGITDAGAERLAAALPQCAVHHHALSGP